MKKALVLTLVLLIPAFCVVTVGLYEFHILISYLYTLTASIVLAETLAGIPKQNKYPDQPALEITAVVPAYLDNEQFIIIETINKIKAAGFKHIVLAYNASGPLPVEQVLHEQADVQAVLVPGSHSKAENLNYVLEHCLEDAPYIAIFDADHWPERSSRYKASKWLREGYDCVQGRCVIRNTVSPLTRLIASEFSTVYRLLHNSRWNLTGTAIFGGSNGYWRTDTLRSFRFRAVLTEDIDLSLRCLSQGVQIAHDPNILSSELAPETIGGLWKQRSRWSLGWLQATLEHSERMLFCRHLNFGTRIYWAYNLVYREIFSLFSLGVLTIFLSYYFIESEPNSPIFGLTTIFTTTSIFIVCLISQRWCDLAEHPYQFWTALIGTIPYTRWKGFVTAMAWTKQVVKDYRWESTKRC